MGPLVIGVAIAAAFAALAAVEWTCYRLGLVRDELPRRDERGETGGAFVLAVGLVSVVLLVAAVIGA